MDINAWALELHLLAIAKGWWDTPRTPLEIHALITSEIGEATQEVRDGNCTVYFMHPRRGRVETGNKQQACEFAAMGIKPEVFTLASGRAS